MGPFYWLGAGSWLVHHRVAALDFGQLCSNTSYLAQITSLGSQVCFCRCSWQSASWWFSGSSLVATLLTGLATIPPAPQNGSHGSRRPTDRNHARLCIVLLRWDALQRLIESASRARGAMAGNEIVDAI